MASSAVSHNIGRSTLFGIAANFVQLFTRLVTVPIVISHLGLDGYGIWSIIMTAAAYMRFGSVGIKCAFQKYVAEATGNGEYDHANKLISTGSFGMLVISLLGLIPISFFTGSITRFAGVPAKFEHSTAWSIGLLALIMVLSNSGAAFEAIVMGAHRIDLVRKFNIVSTVAEAVAVLALLHFGYGLLAMAAVMALSEISYLAYCFIESRRVLPVVQLRLRYISRSVVRELITFGGSYQLVSILELLYVAILPVTVLKFFGAEAAGIYAIATRLVTAALLPQEALLQPMLSGASMVFATGRVDEMQRLMTKAFKTSLLLAVFPLAFVAAFGANIVLAWTGESAPVFGPALALVCVAGLFKSLSLLQLVLYRASGKSSLDNIRQVVRILMLLALGAAAVRLSFSQILAGLAVTELAGMVFMFVALSIAFRGVSFGSFVPDAAKVLLSAAVIAGLGLIVVNLDVPWILGPRTLATLRTLAAALCTVIAALPVLFATRCLSRDEFQRIKGLLGMKAYAGA